MFGDIARFLLNTVFTLFGAALLLRAWLQYVRVASQALTYTASSTL